MLALSRASSTGEAAGPRAWWPLAALVVLAAALRLPTLGAQSFWYDEAFTAVHVFHPSLSATLHAMVRTENSPPLWYLVGWLDVRVLGDGAFALRLPSALAGIATVPVAWAIGRELWGRRAALIAGTLVAVNPLFVWYSQEARVYALFVLTSAIAMLCFLRALAVPSGRRLAAFALAAAIALLTHYFSVFLLAPMALWLLRGRAGRPLIGGGRAAAAAVAVPALTGAALVPLIVAQGGHGTQWIGRWALSSRLEAIPQYYLTGYSGAPLGHGIELLIALPIVLGMALGASALRAPADMTAPAPAPTPARTPAPTRAPTPTPAPAPMPTLAAARDAAVLCLVLLVSGVVVPLALALAGADYLAPRNLVAAMIPLTALVAVLLAVATNERGVPRDRRPPAGAPPARAPAYARATAPLSDRAIVASALACVTALAFAAVSIDVSVSPRLQRGNWRGVAHVLGALPPQTAISTVELASAPLQYYIAGLHNLGPRTSVIVREIDEIGYAPLRSGAASSPVAGFRLLQRVDTDGLITYRFGASSPRRVSGRALRRAAITNARPEVLVPTGAAVTPAAAGEV
jgi:Dolichyl-phosphate-mannose-protein mannosyltransferase